MKTLIKIITTILGVFMLLPGLAKFTEPFHSKFAIQIDKAELLFPSLTFFMRQSGLIITELILFTVLLFSKKLQKSIADKLFYLGNLLVVPVMSVAFYVHMYPAVPQKRITYGCKTSIPIYHSN